MELKDVLIVEDDQHTIALFKKLFSLECLNFKAISVAEDALNILDIINFKVILLDINLGSEVSGIDICVKARELNTNAKIYAVTGFLFPFNADKISVAGFDEIFFKSIPCKYIIDRVVEDIKSYSV